MIKIIDAALLQWVKSLQHIENAVFATPEKAFSKGRLNQNGRIILPAASLFRVSIMQAERWRYPTSRPMPYSYIYKDEDSRKQVSVGVVPVDISYQIDIWTKYQEDMQNILYQLNIAFNPELRLLPIATSGDYRITIPVNCILESLSDNSDLEPDEESDRVLRYTADVSCMTYLISGVKEFDLVDVVFKVDVAKSPIPSTVIIEKCG